MYTIRQAWCVPSLLQLRRVSQKMFYDQQFRKQPLVALCTGRPTPSTLDSVPFSRPPPGSIYSKRALIHSLDIKAPLTLHVNAKMKQAEPKHRVIFYMNLLCSPQPTNRQLISMLMRLARSLLVQRCLYAVWLERNNNVAPIRVRCNCPIPVQRSPVAPDHFAQFNQL